MTNDTHVHNHNNYVESTIHTLKVMDVLFLVLIVDLGLSVSLHYPNTFIVLYTFCAVNIIFIILSMIIIKLLSCRHTPHIVYTQL